MHCSGRNYAGTRANGHGARVAPIKKHPIPGAKIGKCLEYYSRRNMSADGKEQKLARQINARSGAGVTIDRR
jgi:hypothetical protein